MAAIDLFLINSAVDGWQRLSETPAASAATIVGGWVVSTGSTNHSEFEQGVERAASTFTGTTVPDGSLDTGINDALRSENPYNGDFVSADWVAHFVVRAVTVGGAQDGRVRFRLIKADADGSNATEISAGHLQASIVSNVSTSADFDSTLTFNPGAFSITNQYLFLQVAWERTGAGGMTTSDIDFRTGSSSTVGTRITTADFTAGALTVTTPTISSASTLAAPSLAYVVATAAIAAGSAVFAPSVAQEVAPPAIASTAVLSAPSLAYAVSGPTIASTATLTAPEVSQGEALALPTISSTASLATPTLAYEVTAPVIASGATLSAPSTALNVSTPAIPSGSSLATPSLAVEVQPPAIGSTSSLAVPSLATEVNPPAIPSGSSLAAPVLAYAVSLPAIPSGAALSPPSLTGEGDLAGASITSGAQLYAPTVESSPELEVPTIASSAALFAPSVSYAAPELVRLVDVSIAQAELANVQITQPQLTAVSLAQASLGDVEIEP